MSLRFVLRFATALVLAAGSVFSGTIEVNGSCLIGNCAHPDVLLYNNTASSTVSFTYTFDNSDRYQLTGTLSAASTFVDRTVTWQIDSSNIAATYFGNNNNTGSAADSMVVDFLQLYETFGAGSNNGGFESISGSFRGPLANGSSVQKQFLSGGLEAVVMGPFFPPLEFSDREVNQPFSYTYPTLLLDNRYIFAFGAGSGVGATILVDTAPNTAAPEPVTLPFAALTLACLISLRRRQAR